MKPADPEMIINNVSGFKFQNQKTGLSIFTLHCDAQPDTQTLTRWTFDEIWRTSSDTDFLSRVFSYWVDTELQLYKCAV